MTPRSIPAPVRKRIEQQIRVIEKRYGLDITRTVLRRYLNNLRERAKREREMKRLQQELDTLTAKQR